jgi:endopolyphosphatase
MKMRQVDAFSYLDWSSLGKDKKKNKKSSRRALLNQDRFSVAKLLHGDLYESFAALPPRRKLKYENYAIAHTSPSVVPTFLPSIRVWHYNVSNPDDAYLPSAVAVEDHNNQDDGVLVRITERAMQMWDAIADGSFRDLLEVGVMRRRKGRKHRKKKKKPVPRLPRYASPRSPSRTNRYLTPLGYTQYFLPLNEHHSPNWTIEYITYPPESIKSYLPTHMQGNTSALGRAIEAPYQMKEWTIPGLINLAKDVAGSKKLWKDYVRRMYVSSGFVG